MNLPVIAPPVFGPTQASNIRAPSNLGQNIWGSVEQVGGAIGHVSAQAEQIRQKVQNADDAAGIMQIDSLAQAAAARHEDYTRKNSDVSTYGANAEQVWREASGEMDKIYDRISPAAAQHAEAMTSVNKRMFDAKSVHLATTQTVNNAIGVFNAGMEKAQFDMNPDSARLVMDVAVKSGVKSPQEAQKQLEVALNKIDANKYAFAIKTDLWEKDIATKYGLSVKAGGTLSEQQVLMHRRQQEIQQTYARGDTMRELDRWGANPSNDRTGPVPGFTKPGKDGKPESMTIDEIAEQQGLDGKWVEKWKHGGPLTDDDKVTAPIYAEIGHATAKDYDISTDVGATNKARMMHIISASSTTDRMKAQMIQDLERRIAGGVKQEKSHKQAMQEALATEYHEGGTVPLIVEPAKETYRFWFFKHQEAAKTKYDVMSDPVHMAAWEHDANLPDAAKDQARVNYFAGLDMLEKFEETHPNASYAEYEKALGEFLAPLKQAKVADALTPKSTTTTTSSSPLLDPAWEAEYQRRKKAKAKK